MLPKQEHHSRWPYVSYLLIFSLVTYKEQGTWKMWVLLRPWRLQLQSMTLHCNGDMYNRASNACDNGHSGVRYTPGCIVLTRTDFFVGFLFNLSNWDHDLVLFIALHCIVALWLTSWVGQDGKQGMGPNKLVKLFTGSCCNGLLSLGRGCWRQKLWSNAH